MPVRGIRGATTIKQDKAEEVLSATRELLQEMVKGNPALMPADIASVIFTVTGDIRSAFPAKAARQLGWTQVPMVCMQEIPVPGSLPKCIRILLHWNTEKSQSNIKHIYLHQAIQLRPDISGERT